MDIVIIITTAASAITAIVALIRFCVDEYRLHNNSDIKSLNDLKAIKDKLEKKSPERGILNNRYNRLLNSISENSARERYYELYKLENENKLNPGYFFLFFCSMFIGAAFLNLVIGFIIGSTETLRGKAIFNFVNRLIVTTKPKDCPMKIINDAMDKIDREVTWDKDNLVGMLILSFFIILIMLLVVLFVENTIRTRSLCVKSFNEDIRDSYRYRYRYCCEVLTDDSLKKSLALAEKREKQRKCGKYWTFAGGVLYIFLSYITFYLAINDIDERWSLLKIIIESFFVVLTLSIGLIIFLDELFLKFIKKFIRFPTLPKIKTVESENKRWHEDKDKEKYFHKLIEYIAQSRNSVLYIGSEDVKNSIPSRYIDLVSTSYRYMSIEELEQNYESLKKDFYGTIVIDSTILPDHARVLGLMSPLLKPDGELFIRIEKLRGKEAKEELEVDKKTIEEIGNVAYFPTELEPYQMFGFRKNGN